VIVGKIGDLKRAIIFNGDVINTRQGLKSSAAACMTASWASPRQWNTLASRRRLRFATSGGCLFAAAPTGSMGSASMHQLLSDFGFAHPAGDSVTRNPRCS
jgi:hypothetical protein